MADTPSWQADEADSLFELGLTVQLEQRDVVVEGVTIVVMMDVRRRDAQSLGARTAVLLRQVVVAHAHIDCIPRTDYAEKCPKLLAGTISNTFERKRGRKVRLKNHH